MNFGVVIIMMALALHRVAGLKSVTGISGGRVTPAGPKPNWSRRMARACADPCSYTYKCMVNRVRVKVPPGGPEAVAQEIARCSGRQFRRASRKSFCINPDQDCMDAFEDRCPEYSRCFVFKHCDNPSASLRQAFLSCKFVCDMWKDSNPPLSSLFATQGAKPNRVNLTVDAFAVMKRSAGVASLASDISVAAATGMCTSETQLSLFETQDAKPNHVSLTVDASAAVKRSTAGASLLAEELDDSTTGKCSE